MFWMNEWMSGWEKDKHGRSKSDEIERWCKRENMRIISIDRKKNEMKRNEMMCVRVYVIQKNSKWWRLWSIIVCARQWFHFYGCGVPIPIFFSIHWNQFIFFFYRVDDGICVFFPSLAHIPCQSRRSPSFDCAHHHNKSVSFSIVIIGARFEEKINHDIPERAHTHIREGQKKMVKYTNFQAHRFRLNWPCGQFVWIKRSERLSKSIYISQTNKFSAMVFIIVWIRVRAKITYYALQQYNIVGAYGD